MSCSIKPMPLQERLQELFLYDVSTGVIRYVVNRQIAGSLNKRGYRKVRIGGLLFAEHRLIWKHVYGVEPIAQIDHINGQRDDNRIVNLRDVSACLNMQNQRRPNKKNTSGYLGVTKHRAKWRAAIRLHGKTVVIGQYDNPELAYHAYVNAKRQLHAGCTL